VFTISAHDPDFEPGTRRNLDEIARHLAPSQITEAKSLARQCLQTGYVDCSQASQVATVRQRKTGRPVRAAVHESVPDAVDGSSTGT
jgi:hypothetical protein